MNIAVLGTGMVGQTIAAKLKELGHSVIIGTRDVAKTQANRERSPMGTPPFSEWHKSYQEVKLGTYAEAGAFGEILFNCTSGAGSLEALKAAGAQNLGGKILIDISNPLDFSKGMPPSLFVCNTDSLAEQIQRAFPNLKVVKTLNTVNSYVMVNPALIPGDHDLFISGNDAGAKAKVVDILKNWFGWKSVIDFGDLTGARAMEMMVIAWVRLWGVLQTANFNYKIVR